MMIKYFCMICILILIILSDISSVKETFTNQQYILIYQTIEANFNFTDKPKEILVVGYIDVKLISLFKYIYNMNNKCSQVSQIKFVQLGKSNEPIDIYISIDHTLNSKHYKMIPYFNSKCIYKSYYNVFTPYQIINDANNQESYMLMTEQILNEFEKKRKDPIQQISYDPKYNFVIHNTINGKYLQKNMEYDIIILNEKYLNDLIIELNDNMLLKDQEHDFINGEYIVTKINDNNVILERKVKPTEINGKESKKRYVCVDENMNEHTDIVKKESCEHDFSVIGDVIDTPRHWDARCLRNIECPFYDINNDYKYGCNNGYCEFPEDVTRVGFTKYKNNIDECNK